MSGARRWARPLAALPVVLAAACGSAGGSRAGGDARGAEPVAPPDARALERETVVKARTARLVLSGRWRERARLEALRVESGTRDGVPQTLARGAVVFELRGLRLEVADTLEIRWMGPAHENLLLHARDVAIFHQREEHAHRTENVAAATMANETVHFFQQ